MSSLPSKYRSQCHVTNFQQPQRAELPCSGTRCPTTEDPQGGPDARAELPWSGTRCPTTEDPQGGPDARGANRDSLDSASVRVFWGRLPVLIRRPYSVESGPGPWASWRP